MDFLCKPNSDSDSTLITRSEESVQNRVPIIVGRDKDGGARHSRVVRRRLAREYLTRLHFY